MFASTFPKPATTFVPVILAVVAVMAAVLTLPGQSKAVGIYGCSVSPHAPYTFVASSGVKYARAHIYVTCTYSRSGTVTKKIMERDIGYDDEVARQAELFTIPAGTTRGFVITGVCRNFDLGSREELFTEGQLNIGGINSGKAQSVTVSADC
jgi:hypothetical protein